jgi:hypothetical protein
LALLPIDDRIVESKPGDSKDDRVGGTGHYVILNYTGELRGHEGRNGHGLMGHDA